MTSISATTFSPSLFILEGLVPPQSASPLIEPEINPQALPETPGITTRLFGALPSSLKPVAQTLGSHAAKTLFLLGASAFVAKPAYANLLAEHPTAAKVIYISGILALTTFAFYKGSRNTRAITQLKNAYLQASDFSSSKFTGKYSFEAFFDMFYRHYSASNPTIFLDLLKTYLSDPDPQVRHVTVFFLGLQAQRLQNRYSIPNAETLELMCALLKKEEHPEVAKFIITQMIETIGIWDTFRELIPDNQQTISQLSRENLLTLLSPAIVNKAARSFLVEQVNPAPRQSVSQQEKEGGLVAYL